METIGRTRYLLFGQPVVWLGSYIHMGDSENSGPNIVPLNSRILIIRTPKSGTPNFRKIPYTYDQKLQ